MGKFPASSSCIPRTDPASQLCSSPPLVPKQAFSSQRHWDLTTTLRTQQCTAGWCQVAIFCLMVLQENKPIDGNI